MPQPPGVKQPHVPGGWSCFALSARPAFRSSEKIRRASTFVRNCWAKRKGPAVVVLGKGPFDSLN